MKVIQGTVVSILLATLLVNTGACSLEKTEPCLPEIEEGSLTSYGISDFNNGCISLYNDCAYAISQDNAEGVISVFIPDPPLPDAYRDEGLEVLFKGSITIISGTDGSIQYLRNYEVKLAE